MIHGLYTTPHFLQQEKADGKYILIVLIVHPHTGQLPGFLLTILILPFLIRIRIIIPPL